MSRANNRIDRLIDKLGLHEYESLDDVKFYDYIEDGILQSITVQFRERIHDIYARQNALANYLGIEFETIKKDTVKVVGMKTNKQEKQTKRKYVKSGKYSKKPKK